MLFIQIKLSVRLLMDHWHRAVGKCQDGNVNNQNNHNQNDYNNIGE